MRRTVQHVYIVGSKGIPGQYGGYETFVDKLTEHHQSLTELKYHVACKASENGEFTYHNAQCFNIKVPNIGAAQAIYYDIAALKWCVNDIKINRIPRPIVYVLACRIGPFFNHFVRKIHRLGGVVFVNPDGHEWMRAKWSKPIRWYWKQSERLMIKHTDLAVCDSVNIETYIKDTYAKYSPRTTFIAYGAETAKSSLDDNSEKWTQWLNENNLKSHGYYLIVGRFVPENNYYTMIREFMASDTKRSLVIITNAKKSDSFYQQLLDQTHFDTDQRIRFVGTVYDKQLLAKIRENAYAYFHGHEVGGTNPSLLEALSSTELNLLLDVGFNREVAQNSAIYWSKEQGDLAQAIQKAETLSAEQIQQYGRLAKKRIETAYSWGLIAQRYQRLFLDYSKDESR